MHWRQSTLNFAWQWRQRRLWCGNWMANRIDACASLSPTHTQLAQTACVSACAQVLIIGAFHSRTNSSTLSSERHSFNIVRTAQRHALIHVVDKNHIPCVCVSYNLPTYLFLTRQFASGILNSYSLVLLCINSQSLSFSLIRRVPSARY